MAILMNPDRGSFIALDEPELGLHPDMVTTISKTLLQTSMESQLLISTHSDIVLNQLALKNIRVLEKDENNCTIMNGFNEDQFKGWYENFFVGKMWRQGDLGGNRW